MAELKIFERTFTSAEEYVRFRASGKGKDCITKQDLYSLLDECNIPYNTKQLRPELLELVAGYYKDWAEIAAMLEIGVKNNQYIDAFPFLTRANIQKLKEKGDLKVVGTETFHKYGKTLNATIYDLDQFLKMTEKDMLSLLEKYQKKKTAPEISVLSCRPQRTKKEIKNKEKTKIKENLRLVFTFDKKRQMNETIQKFVENIFATEAIYIEKKKRNIRPVTSSDIRTLLDCDEDSFYRFCNNTFVKKGPNHCVKIKEKALLRLDEVRMEIFQESDLFGQLSENEKQIYTDYIISRDEGLIDVIYNNNISPFDIISAVFSNPTYRNWQIVKRYNTVKGEVPSDIASLFPLARGMNRHFILHIGDTNTGKTYDAVQDYMNAQSGVYLGPLRLLAMETQEKLNAIGVPCSLLTGEEEEFIPEATHIASTVEMLDTDKKYEVCVIDEAQMISDDYRGWAWTKAVLGVRAERIHVCMSENARELIIKMIENCGNTYEIVEHKRNTPLVFDETVFHFPKSIKKHDALIVFSRKKVLAIAAELKKTGINASVIYGALPYSVRKNEIRRFMEGETDIIVSTDAIGMGMNLPVERIVFLESSKFDGTEQRLLYGPEIKQIAGRAGRQGMFDIGYINAIADKKYIKRMFHEEYCHLFKAKIQLPEKLLELDIPLSDIIRQWMLIIDDELYEKENMDIIMQKCLFLEELMKNGYMMDKKTMWRFITIPFDEKNEILYSLWEELIVFTLEEGDLAESYQYQLKRNSLSRMNNLEELEQFYKELDLYFSFARAIGYNKDNIRKKITEKKSEIAVKIMKILERTQYKGRKCRNCGVMLNWNYPYPICQDCYEEGRRNRYYEYY